MNTVFNLNQSVAVEAVNFRRIFPRALHENITRVFGALTIFFLVTSIILPRLGNVLTSQDHLFLALFFWSISFFGISIFSYGFLQQGFVSHNKRTLHAALEASKLGEVVNFAAYLDFYAARTVLATQHKGSNYSIRSLTDNLLREKRMKWVCMRLNLNVDSLRKSLAAIPAQPQSGQNDFLHAIELAANHAVNRHHGTIGILDLFSASAVADYAFKRLLFDQGIEPRDFDAIVHWQDRIYHVLDHRRRFWLKENLFRSQPIGKSWAAGFTALLDKYGRDITADMQKGGLDLRIIGRKREIDNIEQVLAKAGENNVLIVGEPGVGRETVLYGFAKRLLEGRSLPQLNRQRLVKLDLSAAIAGLKTVGEVDGRVKQLFAEALNAGNIILVIDNFHHFFRQSFADGVIDISRAILPFIKSARMQLIGVTTFNGYHERIEKLGEFKDAFRVVEIQEPSIDETRHILMDTVLQFEMKYKIFYPYASIKAIVEDADRYIQNVPFPEKAIDLLEEISVLVSRTKRNIVLPEDVAAIVSSKTRVPVGAVAQEEKEKLLNLEEFIHQRIVDQEEAVNTIANAMRRARAGIGNKSKRPIGSFLFLGPTGVGKTETAKALAEAYFGSDQRMIRFDMSEFNTSDAEQRLIGSPATNEEGSLTTAIRENPFTLLLLDELEKAEDKVLNLFLQVLDEGHLTDGWGRKISFTHTIIIATSNAGAEYIRENIRDGIRGETLSKGLIEHLLSKALFKPEFINRFDGTIVFKPLEPQHIVEIIKMMIHKLSADLFHEKGIRIEIDQEAINKLAELGFSQEFGGRELRRILQENIENEMAKKILSGEIKRGDTFKIRSENIKNDNLPSIR